MKRLLLALVLPTVLLVASPATGAATGAAAGAVALPDGPGDVWTFSNTTLGYSPAVMPTADVVRAHVTHGAHALAVRMVLDDLRRDDTQWYWCDVHTAGQTSRFVIEAGRGHWRGLAYQEIQGEWVRVAGLSHHIDYRHDVVVLRVTRTLLGDPPWVRVRLHNELGTGDGTFFTDNPTTASATAAYTARLPHR